MKCAHKNWMLPACLRAEMNCNEHWFLPLNLFTTGNNVSTLFSMFSLLFSGRWIRNFKFSCWYSFKNGVNKEYMHLKAQSWIRKLSYYSIFRIKLAFFCSIRWFAHPNATIQIIIWKPIKSYNWKVKVFRAGQASLGIYKWDWCRNIL